ncbi:Methionine aminopeptidase 1A [Glycine soja]
MPVCNTLFWSSYRGICGLSFANKGRLLHIVGHNGVAYGVNTETGELLKEFKITKKSITSLAFSHDEKYLAIVSSRPRVISWEIGEEILKFPNDLVNVEHISISSDAKNLVTSYFEDQHEVVEGVLLDDDLNEPTLGEKLASLSVLDGNKSRSDIEQESFVPARPPSADSVHVLLKQALNADDRTLLLDCLFTQNEKVVVSFQRSCCSRSVTLCSIIISLCALNETHFVGNVDEESRQLIKCTYECLEKAISIGMYPFDFNSEVCVLFKFQK